MYLIQVLLNGLMIGGVFALVAVGLNLIFGVMKIVNFAQGEFLMIGMFAAYALYSLHPVKSAADIYFLVIPAVIISGVVTLVLYLLLIQNVVGHDDQTQIILTLGLSFFLQGVAQIAFGSSFHAIPGNMHSASLHMGKLTVQEGPLIAFVVAMIATIILSLLLKKTFWGKSIRAVAENRQVSAVLGINSKFIFASAFTVGGILAALGGALLAPYQYVYPSVGSNYVIIAFLVVVIAGLGNVNGSVFGGLFIGIVESITSGYISIDLSVASIYIIFLLVLWFRPEGLFSRKGRVV